MKTRTRIVLYITLALVLAAMCFASYVFVFSGTKKNIKTTHTIKIGERDVSKLITASQFVDFVTVLVSGDRTNEYIEYQTFKVEAGIDLNCDKNTVKIINKPIQLDRTVLREKLGVKKYDSYIKPIQSAYSLKACDIAVQYEILKNAVKNISKSDETIFGIQKDSLKESEPLSVPVNYLPCYFETFGDTLNEDVKKGLLNSLDFEFVSDENTFSRDALKIKIKGMGKETFIQIGYTGKKFPDDTFESFRERLQTENEQITVFSYFDPLDDINSKQVVSYASDGYRTAFVLHAGKLYYIDLVASDAQTRENLSNLVLYLAMSIKFDDEKEDISDEYIKYLEYIDESLNFLRKKRYSEFNVTVKNLVAQKEGYSDENECGKMLRVASDYFSHKAEKESSGNKEFDQLIENAQYLYESQTKEGNYALPETRAKILQEISKRTKLDKEEIRSNMLAYFLQKDSQLNLTEKEKNAYLNELTERACVVDRIILESFETDKERNNFYLSLFKNAYKNDSGKYHEENYADMTFLYTQSAWETASGSARIDTKLKERNNDIPLGNTFVFLFSESDLPVLSSSREEQNHFKQLLKDIGKSIDNATKSVHAIVLDNCSVRLFCCLDDDSVFEAALKGLSKLKKILTQTNTVKKKQASDFIYFWDWRNMNIHKDGTAFLGFDFSNTSSRNAVANRMFKRTERYEEISTIGTVLLKFQNAYEKDDFHYEQAQEFFDRQIRNYVYDSLWRPSLNVSDAETNDMALYNYSSE